TEESMTLDATPALVALTNSALVRLLDADAALEGTVAESFLQALCRNADVASSYGRYVQRYLPLTRRLQEARGYGLEGDAEPEISMDGPQLLAWTRNNRQDAFNEFQGVHVSSSQTAH